MSLPANEYCERLSDQFWAEPINALTNMSFIFAAIAIFFLLNRRGIKQWYYWLLPYSLAIVGIGSFLWHTIRTPFTHVLDASLLYVFLLLVLIFLLKLLFNKWSYAWFGAVGLVLFQMLVFLGVPALRDTPIRHIIVLITFSGLLFFTYQKWGKIPAEIFISISLYVAAIIFKGVDLLVCQSVPIGTHFLWHTLGGIAGYFSVSAILQLNTAQPTKKIIYKN